MPFVFLCSVYSFCSIVMDYYAAVFLIIFKSLHMWTTLHSGLGISDVLSSCGCNTMLWRRRRYRSTRARVLPPSSPELLLTFLSPPSHSCFLSHNSLPLQDSLFWGRKSSCNNVSQIILSVIYICGMFFFWPLGRVLLSLARFPSLGVKEELMWILSGNWSRLIVKFTCQVVTEIPRCFVLLNFLLGCPKGR